MDFSERQKRIIEKLRPKSISHGQLDTELIAVPESQAEEIAPARWQVIRESFEVQGSNLVPVIVRRTEAYDNEEYEVVYGTDWCLVAKDLEIDKLWVWVFDLTDEQAVALKNEMEELLGVSSPSSITDESKQIKSLFQQLEYGLQKQIASSVKQELQPTLESVQELFRSFQKLQEVMSSEIKALHYEVKVLNCASMTKKALDQLAREREIPGRSKMTKHELAKEIAQKEG